MVRSIIKYTVSLFSILLFTININAQDSFFSNGLNVGIKGGTSILLAEVPTNFSHKINEFENKIGFAIDAELSKYLSNHWEIAIEFNYSVLNGETQNPSFSAEGHHPVHIEPITEPVEYNNTLTGSRLFFRFYLTSLGNQNEGVNIYPFISAGVGYLNYKSTFQYIDEIPTGSDKIIFSKGYDNSASLTTINYSIGGGLKTTFSSKLYIISSINGNIVPYDFLDVVHNFDANGDRISILGLYTQFKIGIFYSLTPFTPGQGRSKKSTGPAHLPFGQ